MSRMIDADKFENRMYHEAFERDSDMQKWDSGCWIRYRLFEEVLRGQPTVTPEPHWIPVTERLPKKSGRYYVTEQAYNVDDRKHEGVCWTTTDMADYSAEEKRWIRARFLKVVAWMEREPYKGVNT